MPKFKHDAHRELVEQRKEQILSAATQVFARKGFDRATIAEIAKTAGVAEGSIYNYFRNKADLLVSIPHQAIQPTVEAVSAQLFRTDGPPPPPEVMLTTAARNMTATMRQNADILRILLSALPTMKQATRNKYVHNVVAHATGMLEAYFREQIQQGIFRRDVNPTLYARLFVGMFFPFVMLQEVLQVEETSRFDYEQVIAQAVRIFLNGALSDSGKREPK